MQKYKTSLQLLYEPFSCFNFKIVFYRAFNKQMISGRSNSKPSSPQNLIRSTQNNLHKKQSSFQKLLKKTKKKSPARNTQPKLKTNIIDSLIELLDQKYNEPSVIHPWLKGFYDLEKRILGENNIIIGPSQSGKFSAVKYALKGFNQGKYVKQEDKVKQVIINCQLSSTEHQFYTKFLEEFNRILNEHLTGSTTSRRIFNGNKIYQTIQQTIQLMKTTIVSQDIDFTRLNPYIKERNLKFVIIIKNGQNLVSFHKQTILYNLFQWVKSDVMKQNAGLTILTKRSKLIDLFQKRVRSRFCGHKLFISRPQEAQVIINIIQKRITTAISHRITSKQKQQQKTEQNPQKTTQTIIKCKQQYQYLSSLKQSLTEKQIKQLKLQNYLKQQKSRNLSNVSELDYKQQINCLDKIKSSIIENPQLKFLIQQKMLKDIVVPITFFLRTFQYIFSILDQKLIKSMSQPNFNKLIKILLQKNMRFQFPFVRNEQNFFTMLSSIQIMVIVFIYKMIFQNKDIVKLTKLYHEHGRLINQMIFQTTETETKKQPTKIILRALCSLKFNRIIDFVDQNIYNSPITFRMSIRTVQQGLTQHFKNKQPKQLLKDTLRELDLIS